MGREVQALRRDLHGRPGQPLAVLAVEHEQAVPLAVEPAQQPAHPVQAALVEAGVVLQVHQPVGVHEEMRLDLQRVLEEQPHPAHGAFGGDDQAVVAAVLDQAQHLQQVRDEVGLLAETRAG